MPETAFGSTRLRPDGGEGLGQGDAAAPQRLAQACVCRVACGRTSLSATECRVFPNWTRHQCVGRTAVCTANLDQSIRPWTTILRRRARHRDRFVDQRHAAAERTARGRLVHAGEGWQGKERRGASPDDPHPLEQVGGRTRVESGPLVRAMGNEQTPARILVIAAPVQRCQVSADEQRDRVR